jgi:hypothetical protein
MVKLIDAYGSGFSGGIFVEVGVFFGIRMIKKQSAGVFLSAI